MSVENLGNESSVDKRNFYTMPLVLLAMIRHTLLTLVFLLSTLPSLAQVADTANTPRGTISGKLVDAVTQAPVAGATILVVGTKKGAVSTTDGKFVIKNVEPGIVTLRVSRIGYGPELVNDVVVSPGKPVTVFVQMQELVVTSKEAVIVEEAFRKDAELVTSTQMLTSEEVRRAPGVQEDVVRAVALLPGVAVTQAGRNDLAVRGGAPFENLFLVDNIEVPNINHFGTQGSSGGPLSIINIDFVRDVSLSTGGFGPRYGDRLSSVTNIQLRDGNDQELSGEINLSATGFGVIGEGPLGSNGSWMVSARRSYLDLIFKLAGFGFIPEYYDLTAKASYTLDPSNSISFLLIGALGTVTFNNDSADKRYSNSRVVAPTQNQYFSGLTWRHLFDKGFLTVTLGRTFTDYKTTQQDSLGSTIFQTYSTEGENSLRADVTLLPSPTVEITFGSLSKYGSQLSYDILVPGYARLDQNGVPRPLVVDTSFQAFRTALYGQMAWQFSERWKLTLGGRFDYYAYLPTSAVVSPRLALAYELTSTTTIALSGGRFYQAPQYIWLVGDPSNTKTMGPMHTDQAVLSYQWIVTPEIKVQVEGYYKVYGGYPARLFRPQAVLAPSGFDDIYSDIPFGLEPLSNGGTGTAYGVEIFIQKKLSPELPFYGLTSISFNRTQFVAADGVQRLGAFDTPIIGTIAVGYRPAEQWEVSSKLRMSQGLPSTPFITTAQAAAETNFPIGSLDFRYYNAGPRLPFFYALDVRVDKRWFFSGWQLITYIDVQNITGRKNVSGYKWNQQTQQVEAQQSIGVLPSIGVNIEF